MRLEDKVAIITGAARGIGKETALIFAREGAKVVVADVIREAGQETVDEIKDMGKEAFFAQVDVSNREDVDAMVKETLERYGKIDILINNAGIVRDSTLLKMTEEQWDLVININLKGVFNCAQAVARVMVEQGNGGSIINTSSAVGIYGNFGQTNYAATKAGVIGFTKALAKEVGRKGIRVNAVAPGFIDTPMLEKIPANVIEMVKERVPLQRLGRADEVANMYLYLASADAGYINGAVLSIDGGLVI
ncbi:3-oxoacyl-ACP reductase FabG [archaeon]|nr:3-oxoacyl-ACP reductase FabG [archaeon]